MVGDSTYKEARLCPIVDCPLYPYRFGRRPIEADNERLKQTVKGWKNS